MSMWTHIVAAIDLDTYEETVNLVEYVYEQLKNAPKITGSERNADIFVNQLSGHNRWTSEDCARCKYKDQTCIENGIEYCCPPEDFNCPSGEYQTRVVITVLGDLRDRVKEQTEEEWNEFVKYIAYTSGEIRNITCNIKE